MAYRIDAELARRDGPCFPARIGIEATERIDCRQGSERVVADGVGAKRRAHARIVVSHAERADEIRGIAAPARPFVCHAWRQVLTEAEARAREVAEKLGDCVEADMGGGPHPQPAERRPIAPVAALRADEQRAADALGFRQQPERLSAEAVPDDQHVARQVPQSSGRIEQRPVAHARRHLAQVAVFRATDAAVIEGQDAEAPLREICRELGVIGLRHAGRRHDEQRPAGPECRGADRVAVGRGERYLHEFHRSDARPTRISPSMKRTCRWACIRFTSQAAIALPGIVATPITTPVANVCSSSSAKRWNSAALQTSSAMLIIASVASTAGPAMPVPSSSEIMITPAPLATPLARPNTAEPTARPVVPSAMRRRFSARPTATEASTTMPSTGPVARASRTL